MNACLSMNAKGLEALWHCPAEFVRRDVGEPHLLESAAILQLTQVALGMAQPRAMRHALHLGASEARMLTAATRIV